MPSVALLRKTLMMAYGTMWQQLTRAVVIAEIQSDYIDGAEGEFYGQWGQTNVSTGVNDSFRIGARWDLSGSRFIGAIDDVRLYSKDFSQFDIQNLVREGSGLPVDVTEESYTLSVWAKPNKLAPVMDYKIAMGWYEGGLGGVYASETSTRTS